jgi:hypothetical protein
MKRYDPDAGPGPEEWLRLEDADRMRLVDAYHRRTGVRLPNTRVHACIHTIVENQLALGEAVVVDVLRRLRTEGLSRHDAVHAIGSVLIGHLHALATGTRSEADGPAPYFEALKRLTAEQWLRS